MKLGWTELIVQFMHDFFGTCTINTELVIGDKYTDLKPGDTFEFGFDIPLTIESIDIYEHKYAPRIIIVVKDPTKEK